MWGRQIPLKGEEKGNKKGRKEKRKKETSYHFFGLFHRVVVVVDCVVHFEE
jgi:hypothetical protein